MTTIRVRFNPPAGPTEGQIRFTPRHDTDNRPLVVGQDIITGDTGWINVPVEGREIEVRHSEPGWHYVIRGQATGAPSFSTTVLVPNQESIDFEELVRYDPKAGMAYEPDPAWWAWVRKVVDKEGVPGEDAYQLAVRNGFTGTEQEWLASLEGPQGDIGPAGKTAYQVAVDEGFNGTKQAWLDSLVGEDGDEGKSAYQLAVEAGFVGTEQEWLDSLVGPEGTGSTNEDIAGYVDADGPTADALRDRFSLKDAVDARLYGLVEGTGDAAPALNAAADAARLLKRPLFVPVGTYYTDSPVNLRYLDVDVRGSIVLRHETGIGVTVGDTSAQRLTRRIYVREVIHEGYSTSDMTRAYAALRVVGLKSAEIHVGRTSIMEVWASDANAQDDSIAYCNFHLGRVNFLKIIGVGNNLAWINENTFIGGSYGRIFMDGPYPHNNNKFIKPAVEGPAASDPYIWIERGQGNMFEDLRSEGATKLILGPNANLNQFLTLWQSNTAIIGGDINVTQGMGNNTLLSRQELNYDRRIIARLDVDTLRSGTFCEVKGTNPARITAHTDGKRLTVTNTWSVLFDFTIPLADVLPPNATQVKTIFPSSVAKRFLIRSDAVLLRPEIQGFDANGDLMLPADQPFMSTWGPVRASSDKYDASTQVSGYQVLITNPDVKYLRFYARNQEVGSFHHITITSYLEKSQDPGIVHQQIRAATNRVVPS